MIGTVSTGRCHMPPARDRSGTLNHFFLENFEISDKPKSDHIVFFFRNIFCREIRSDIKGPTCFDHNLPCFFSRYKRDDMGAGYCTPHQTEKVIFRLFLLHHFAFFSHSFSGLHRLWLWSLCWRHCLHWLLNQFKPVQTSNKESFHIFSCSKYAKRLNSAVSNKYLYLLTTSSCVNRVGDFVKPEPFENEIKENRKSLTAFYKHTVTSLLFR